MKCPHCGIEIRDSMTECMYCGGKIPQRKGTPPPVAGKAPEIGARGSPASAKRPAGVDEGSGEEEEPGLSAFLQPGEQILIGSLSVSVKKFFFHAYLTNQRIFLIDTQEKKLKVTAKDIPLATISGSIVEMSESSDPVLVLSIRSADDEVKTMKLVFTGNGLDRSAEADEWIELLNEQIQPGKPKKPVRRSSGPRPEEQEPEPAGEEEEEAPAPARKPQVIRQELRPIRKPVKDHEKQPPVKRLLPVYQAPSDEEMEDLPPQPKPVSRPPAADEGSRAPPAVREIPPSREQGMKPVRKVEVQSAMKTALRGAIPAARSHGERPGVAVPKRPVQVQASPEPARPEPEEEETAAPAGRGIEGEETAGPVFCQNCGKKLPVAANFCPGCGAKIGVAKERPVRPPQKSERRPEETVPEKEPEETPRPARPPIKKAPKGSEMTILHKFLRR